MQWLSEVEAGRVACPSCGAWDRAGCSEQRPCHTLSNPMAVRSLARADSKVWRQVSRLLHRELVDALRLHCEHVIWDCGNDPSKQDIEG